MKLSNIIDVERLALGEDVSPREMEVEAVVDTGAVRSVIPARIARELGLRLFPGRGATLADGNRVEAGRSMALQFEILGRCTQEDAIVLGDEVLIGQTTLEATGLVLDCANQRVFPNPDNPTGALKVRGARP